MQTRPAPPGGLSPAQSWALTQGLGVRLLSISSVSGGEGERREHCGLLASHPLFDALQQKPCLRTPQQKGHCRGRGGGTMDAQDAKMLLQVL